MSRVPILAALVALITLAAALVLGLILGGADDRTTPLASTVIGLIAPSVIGLLALLRSDQANTKVNTVDNKLDALSEKVNGNNG